MPLTSKTAALVGALYVVDVRSRAIIVVLAFALAACGSKRAEPAALKKAAVGSAAQTPDLVGMTLEQVLERKNVVTYLDGERFATSVPGTVLAQEPAPDSEQYRSPPQVTLTVAVPRAARACRTGDLSARYVQGGRGQGQQFGGVVVANTSSQMCRLRGRLRLRGYARDGSRVTDTVRHPIKNLIVLSPRSTTRSELPALLALIPLGGPARDDPQEADGQCRTWTRPATWEIRFSSGARVRFRNGRPGLDRSFVSCRGRIYFANQLGQVEIADLRGR
jgi:hypothetical protein